MEGTLRLPRKPEGYRQQTISSSSVGLAAATGGIPPAAVYAEIEVEAQPIRYRDDGTAPTASVGMPVVAATVITLYSRAQIDAFRAIAQSTDSKLNISYYSADRQSYQ